MHAGHKTQTADYSAHDCELVRFNQDTDWAALWALGEKHSTRSTTPLPSESNSPPHIMASMNNTACTSWKPVFGFISPLMTLHLYFATRYSSSAPDKHRLTIFGSREPREPVSLRCRLIKASFVPTPAWLQGVDIHEACKHIGIRKYHNCQETCHDSWQKCQVWASTWRGWN